VGVGVGPVVWSGAAFTAIFALESVVCDVGGTECIAVHMELEIVFLLICFKSSIVLCIGPYSCLLFRICIVYADWGLLFFYVSDVFLVT
jgi:hypothetical protein